MTTKEIYNSIPGLSTIWLIFLLLVAGALCLMLMVQSNGMIKRYWESRDEEIREIAKKQVELQKQECETERPCARYEVKSVRKNKGQSRRTWHLTSLRK